MISLQKISIWDRKDHFNIDQNDKCLYLLDYTSEVGFAYSEANNLIINCKKSLETKGTPQFRYKIEAIKRIAGILNGQVNNDKLLEISFVPIPPSKSKQDPLYDDRLIKILEYAFGNDADIREIIIQKESRQATHLCINRPSIEDHIDNYIIDNDLIDGLRSTVIIFDDILTTGAHFKACKRKLIEINPELSIIGLFIARRVFKKD